MNSLEGLIINSTFILFPICLYIIYCTSGSEKSVNQRDVFLELTVFSSLYLMFRFGILFKSFYPGLLFTIPLLLCYLNNKVKISLLVSLILIIFLKFNFKINIILLLFEYILYFILYIYYKKNYKNYYFLTNGFIIIRTFIISLLTKNNNFISYIFYFLSSAVIYMMTSYFIVEFYKNLSKTLNYKSTLVELKKEKNIHAELFKILHEIKNPLAVCRGYLDILDSGTKKDYDKYIPLISTSIRRTFGLMDDYLSFSKINVSREEGDLVLFLDEFKEGIIPLLEKNNVDYIFLIPDSEVYFKFDYDKLKQVLINIYKNSIEALDDRRTIKLKAYLAFGSFYIEIKDYGKGMDAYSLENIGNNFYTTKEHGTGLGVSLSKEIIRLHNGSLIYKSKLERGTTCIISFPIN